MSIIRRTNLRLLADRPRVLVGGLAIGACVTTAAVGLLPAHADHRNTDSRTARVASALGVAAHDMRLSAWSPVDTNTGHRFSADISGVGLAQVDAKTGEVDELIFDRELSIATGAIGSKSVAVAMAAKYAATRYAGFSGLRSRGAEYIDHVSWAEYRVEWQANAGAAWLPSRVAVGVNARTGNVAYYYSERVATSVSTTRAAVSAGTARHVALRTAKLGHGATASTPELSVEVYRGRQQLVWVVPVRPAQVRGPQILNDKVVWVDAATGVGTVWASS